MGKRFGLYITENQQNSFDIRSEQDYILLLIVSASDRDAFSSEWADMTNYIFIPVPTEEMRSLANKWQDGQQEAQKEPCTILVHRHDAGIVKGLERRFGSLLKNVTPTDKLYILAHGIYENDAAAAPVLIGARRSSGGGKTYSPAALASVLESEGLPKTVRDVRVFACGSGTVGPDGPWAQQLKTQLSGLGYNQVMVSGYEGDVYPEYGTRYASLGVFAPGKHKGTLINGMVYRASSRRFSF